MSKAKATAKKRGRKPQPISKAVQARICQRVSLGFSLRSVLRAKGMPSRSKVMESLQEDALFADQYARARRQGIELHIDEIIELADTANAKNAQAVRLKVDVRKWLASKLVPKVYGDRLDLAVESPLESPAVSDEDLAKWLAFEATKSALRRAKEDPSLTAHPALPAPPPDPRYRDVTPSAEVRAKHPGAGEIEINPLKQDQRHPGRFESHGGSAAEQGLPRYVDPPPRRKITG